MKLKIYCLKSDKIAMNKTKKKDILHGKFIELKSTLIHSLGNTDFLHHEIIDIIEKFSEDLTEDQFKKLIFHIENQINSFDEFKKKAS
jgi:hypothetical protein